MWLLKPTNNIIYKPESNPPNKTKTITVLGFEEPGDLTLFALSGLAYKNNL